MRLRKWQATVFVIVVLGALEGVSAPTAKTNSLPQDCFAPLDLTNAKPQPKAVDLTPNAGSPGQVAVNLCIVSNGFGFSSLTENIYVFNKNGDAVGGAFLDSTAKGPITPEEGLTNPKIVVPVSINYLGADPRYYQNLSGQVIVELAWTPCQSLPSTTPAPNQCIPDTGNSGHKFYLRDVVGMPVGAFAGKQVRRSQYRK